MGGFGIEFGMGFGIWVGVRMGFGLELDWAKGLCLEISGWAIIILFFILAVKF